MVQGNGTLISLDKDGAQVPIAHADEVLGHTFVTGVSHVPLDHEYSGEATQDFDLSIIGGLFARIVK